MYKVEKRFTIPVGHRLSKHKERCKNIHGHNLSILVGIRSTVLNSNDMVLDFSELKKTVNALIDDWDHSILINETDTELRSLLFKQNMRHHVFPFDPTAEKIAETIYKKLVACIQDAYIYVDYVTVFENENSKATYTND